MEFATPGRPVSAHAAWRPLAIGGLVAGAVFQLLDVISTYLVLAAGGVEANPISRGLMESAGMEAWIGLKLVIVASFLALVPFVRRSSERDQATVAVLGALAAGLMAAVVVNNAAIVLLVAG
ncbi:MAG: DUF5658 family protein [Thermoplasmatota archaeon]